VPNFFDLLVFKEGTERFYNRLRFVLIFRQAQVVTCSHFPRKGDAHQLRFQGIEASGFGIKTNRFLLEQLLQQ